MVITNKFRTALRKALADLPRDELEIIAGDARPDADTPLPAVSADTAVLAQALIRACETEGGLAALLRAARDRRPTDAVLADLDSELPGLLAVPGTAVGATPASAPVRAGMLNMEAGRDLYQESTVDRRNVGGAEFGDGTSVYGPVVGSIGTAHLYFGLAAPPTGEGFSEGFERRYLRLLLRYAWLRPLLGGEVGPGRGISGAVAVPHVLELNEAFVALSLAPYGVAMAVGAPTALVSAAGRLALSPPSNQLGPLLATYPRLVILGAPGAGKTTLLRHLAVLNAAACLARLALPAGADPERVPDVAELAGRPAAERAVWQQWALLRDQLWTELGWLAPRYPLLVNMRHLRDVRAWPKERRLHEAIELDAEALGFAGCPADFFAHRLRAGQVVLLLDAFDELGSREARDRMATLTGTLLADFCDPHDPAQQENRVLASARPVGYEDQLGVYNFVNRQVQSLDSGQQLELVRRYYAAFGRMEARAQGAQAGTLTPEEQTRLGAWSDDLLARLGLLPPGRPGRPVNYRLRALSDNPLLLSLIVARHYSGYDLPDERHLLYQECVERLVQDWRRSQGTEDERSDLGPVEDLKPTDKLELLGGLALLAQERRTDAGVLAGAIPELEVEAYLAERLGGEFAEKYSHLLTVRPPVDSPAREEFWAEQARLWIRGIEARAGLVHFGGFDRASGARVLEFAHQTFQEYLSAWALWRKANKHPAPEILAHVRKPGWQEVVLLYLLLQPRATDPLVRRLLPRPGPAGLILLGRILGEPDLRPYVDTARQADILAALRDVFARPQATETLATRQAVANVLQQISDQEPRASQILEAALTDPGDPAIRAGAAQALRGVAGDAVATGSVVTRLTALAFDSTRADPILAVRLSAAATIAVLGDPRMPGAATNASLSAPALVLVDGTPAGGFLPGLTPEEVEVAIAQFSDQSPVRARRRLADETNDGGPCVDLPPFAIGRYPVSNQEYGLYVAAGGRAPASWKGGRYPPEAANHPVTGVDVADVWAYCDWLTARLTDGAVYRLPAEAEWEWAGRGPNRRLWPWGADLLEGRCNSAEAGLGGPSPVGLFPAGATPAGVQDMAGNVWELTASTFVPYGSDWPAVTALPAPAAGLVLRGGCYSDAAFSCRITTRVPMLSIELDYVFGFRLMRVVP